VLYLGTSTFPVTQWGQSLFENSAAPPSGISLNKSAAACKIAKGKFEKEQQSTNNHRQCPLSSFYLVFCFLTSTVGILHMAGLFSDKSDGIPTGKAAFCPVMHKYILFFSSHHLLSHQINSNKTRLPHLHRRLIYQVISKIY
jgi:hypothetical protein